MIKKSSKLGFTMAEMMVCLSVIAVIATILIPTIATLRPDKEKAMFKKAYQITERVVSELVNDPDLYPNDPEFFGFDNIGYVVYNGKGYGAKYRADTSCNGINDDTVCEENNETCKECKEINHDNNEAKRKFCLLFALKLNTVKTAEGRNCQEFSYSSTDNDAFNPTFTTTDGIVWSMPATYFTSANSEKEGLTENPNTGTRTRTPVWTKIIVDINGDKGPNQIDNEDAKTGSCGLAGSVDRFIIWVRSDGKVAVKGACAITYLNSDKIIPDNINIGNSGTGSMGDLSATGSVAHERGGDDSEWWDETKPVENAQPSTP